MNFYQTKVSIVRCHYPRLKYAHPTNRQGHPHGACRPLGDLCNVPAGLHFVRRILSAGCRVIVLTVATLSDRLGCAAVFLIGGLTRDDPPTPILLRSGDVVIMSGPACRRAYHGRSLIDRLPVVPLLMRHGVSRHTKST